MTNEVTPSNVSDTNSLLVVNFKLLSQSVGTHIYVNMETFHFPCFDAHRSTVYYALFCDVERPLVLKNRIIAAATAEGEDGQHEREALNFAFIDARLVCLSPWLNW